MNNIFRISFDIGGVLSKYPSKFYKLILALSDNPNIEIYVITDIPDHDRAVKLIQDNGFPILAERVLSADYNSYGEKCKEEIIKQYKIDMHIDDFLGYVAHTSCINLLVCPNPNEPYYADEFLTDGSEGKFGRRIKNI